MSLSRRDWLLLALGAGGGAAAAGLARLRGAVPRLARVPDSPRAVRDSLYGTMLEPPADCGPGIMDALTIPPPRGAPAAPVTLAVQEGPVEVAHAQLMLAWTFNGRIPGPILRATEGDPLTIHFRNLGAHPHNLHFHGTHALPSDGWQPVPPGGEATVEFTAGPAGLHPYHCDMTPAPEHISHGLYGALLVDPRAPRPPAREVVLVLGGYDLDGDGKSELYGWNGVAGYYMKFPVKVRAGELVRAYVVNMVADEPVISFHLHAQVFDVYPGGMGDRPAWRADVLTLATAERAMIEFRLPDRGRYMFHPHQARLAERGAMGWFAAV